MVQIVDRKKLLEGPTEPTPANLLYPEVGRLVLPPNAGAHTAFPLLQMDVAEFAHDKEGGTRDFLAVVDETLVNECQEARQMLWIADITAESRPFGVATFTVPEASGDFCSRGGRFGTHSSNENFTPIYYKRLLFLAHFNAGVRAVDIRDPYHPREVAYFHSRRSPRRPSRAASKWAAPTAARSPSRPTMSRSTIAAISTWSIAPIPACTYSN